MSCAPSMNIVGCGELMTVSEKESVVMEKKEKNEVVGVSSNWYVGTAPYPEVITSFSVQPVGARRKLRHERLRPRRPPHKRA